MASRGTGHINSCEGERPKQAWGLFLSMFVYSTQLEKNEQRTFFNTISYRRGEQLEVNPRQHGLLPRCATQPQQQEHLGRALQRKAKSRGLIPVLGEGGASPRSRAGREGVGGNQCVGVCVCVCVCIYIYK